MNGREYFHESVVRDIVDVLTSLKDYEGEYLAAQTHKFKQEKDEVVEVTEEMLERF